MDSIRRGNQSHATKFAPFLGNAIYAPAAERQIGGYFFIHRKHNLALGLRRRHSLFTIARAGSVSQPPESQDPAAGSGQTMAKEGRPRLGSITDALTEAAATGAKGLPPVERWDPPFCGDLDMRIAADGTWFYLKTPIGRPALVKLFAAVLKRENDKYFLVTPVEKCGIAVDDAPFLAVELAVEATSAGRVLRFRTNVDDWVACGAEHALRFEPEAGTGGLKPYLHVRRDLWAKVTRALFFDLVELGEEREVEGKAMFGVASMGVFFAMAPADQVRDLA
jgi:uncharacterized protein